MGDKEESPVRKHKINMPQPRRRDDPGTQPRRRDSPGHNAESQMLTVPQNCIGKKRTPPSELTLIN